MQIFPAIKELPERYHTLSLVRSVEVKLMLAERIKEILTLLDFFRVVQADEDTKALIDRFFTLLHKHTDHPVKVNEWSLWICRYADVVIDKLLDTQFGHVLNRENQDGKGDATFHRKIMALTDALESYGRHRYHRRALNALSFYFIGEIIALSVFVPSAKGNDIATTSKYNALSQLITQLTEQVEQAIQLGVMTSDTFVDDINQQLHQIYFHTYRYVSYKKLHHIRSI
jgi:hypothetical protein